MIVRSCVSCDSDQKLLIYVSVQQAAKADQKLVQKGVGLLVGPLLLPELLQLATVAGHVEILTGLQIQLAGLSGGPEGETHGALQRGEMVRQGGGRA